MSMDNQGMKGLWQSCKTRSDVVYNDAESHKVWNSECSNSEYSASSALLTSQRSESNATSSAPDPHRRFGNGYPSQLPTPVGEWPERESESEPRESEVEPSYRGHEACRSEPELEQQTSFGVGQMQTSAMCNGSRDAPAESNTQAPAQSSAKNDKKPGPRQRPPKVQRAQAKKLAMMLFEANTDEDREAAEIEFMEATDAEPQLYDYAMTVLHWLRGSASGAQAGEM